MSRIIRLAESFTDNTLPMLRADPVLNAGSLLLLEPNHPANPIAAGLPTDGSFIPNIAVTEAAAMTGVVASSDTLKGTYRRAGLSGTANTLGLTERTGKGGLHTILTQSAFVSGSAHQGVELPAAAVTFMLANPSHSFYINLWARITRVTNPAIGTGSSDPWADFIYQGASTYGLYLFTQFDAQVRPAVGASRLGFQRTNENTVGPTFMDVGAITTDPALLGSNYATANKLAWTTGTLGAFVTSNTYNKWRSAAWYRTYIEDLTVSGQTYAQAAAKSLAEYNKQVINAPVSGAGGRYYNDTFTAPSSIA